MTALRSMLARTTRRCPTAGIFAALVLASPTGIAIAQQSNEQSNERVRPSQLVREVRAATKDFRDVNAAVAAGYVSTGHCVTGPNQGAMGVHYINASYLEDGQIDASRPEILVYAPTDGQLRLAAVEYFVIAEQWDAANEAPPTVGGQLFNYAGAPNRLRSPPYYELHVWAWKHNPNGTFVDWNPEVSCDGYSGEANHAAGH